MRRRKPAPAPEQAGLFEERPEAATALARYEPPPPHIGRLLGWVYPGDVLFMYGKSITVTQAYSRMHAWWRKYRGPSVPHPTH